MAAREWNPKTTAADRAREKKQRLQCKQEFTAEENRITAETGKAKCLVVDGRVNTAYRHLLLSWQTEILLNGAVNSG